MKKIIKSFFGNFLIFKIKYNLVKWFPSKTQKDIIKQELIEVRQRKLFYGSFIKKDDLCFDVGANEGNRITPLLELGAKIVAVEPQEDCYKILQYKFGKNIQIVTKGLGASDGVKNFYISNASTISSFSDEWINSVRTARFKDYNWDKCVKVEMTTLDSLIDKYGQPIFIKIDVEGYELEVLKGLTKSINMISFEYTVPEQTNMVIECIELIEKNDKNIECNYSVGESMEFKLQNWQSVTEFKNHISTDEFLSTGFGDIYVRIKNIIT
jgi:FkbM family methyltransferase